MMWVSGGDNELFIVNIASLYNLSPYLLAAVVLNEIHHNGGWKDWASETVQELLGELGVGSWTYGDAQISLARAAELEAEGYVPASSGNGERFGRLLDPHWAVLYAAAQLANVRDFEILGVRGDERGVSPRLSGDELEDAMIIAYRLPLEYAEAHDLSNPNHANDQEMADQVQKVRTLYEGAVPALAAHLSGD
jgi:hypothetical protein